MSQMAPRYELKADGPQNYVVLKNDTPAGWVGISAIRKSDQPWRAVTASGTVSRHMSRTSAVAAITGDHNAHT